MKLNSFLDDFTKRWSTLFVALIGFLSFLFAIYGIIIGLTHEPEMLLNKSDNFFKNIFNTTAIYSTIQSPISSTLTYLLSYKIFKLFKTNRIENLKIIILVTFIFFLLSYPSFIPYGGYIDVVFFNFLIGIPLLLFNLIFYILLFIFERHKHFRIPNNKITKNKYYKICTLLFFFYLPICCIITILLFN